MFTAIEAAGTESSPQTVEGTRFMAYITILFLNNLCSLAMAKPYNPW